MADQLGNLLRVQEPFTYFRHPNLSRGRDLVHAIFSRLGGVSGPPFESLNISYRVGDLPENVTANIRIIREVMGATRVMFLEQSHGDRILVLREGYDKTPSEVPCADAMITNIPGLGLLVKQADCQGVIIFDPEKRVVANVHCGWRGNVANILGRVAARMEETFGCNGSRLLAAIGPSLGPCCAEFVNSRAIFPAAFDRFRVTENHFDLWAISRHQLVEAGLQQENIEIAGICTRCRTDLFYSYRGEGRTGRFGTVAMLKP
jgi:YfiH family protein